MPIADAARGGERADSFHRLHRSPVDGGGDAARRACQRKLERARAASRYQIMTSFKIPPRRNARATRVGSIGRSIGRPFGSYPVLFHPNPHPLHRLARRRGAVGTCTFLFCCCCHLFSRPREKHGRRRGRVRRRRRLRRQT